MTKPNQGYRKDLNLGETPSERKALASLAGAGIDADIDRIVNNLRNTSDISFHNLKDGFFNFSEDITVGITSLRCSKSNDHSGLDITAHLDRSYKLRVGDLFKIQNVTGTGKVVNNDGNFTGANTSDGSSIFNGEFALTSLNAEQDQFTAIKYGFNTQIRDQNIDNATNLIIRGDDVFVYTNDDKITFDRDVNVKVTLSDGTTNITNYDFIKGTPYYVCDSDGERNFKLSIRPSYDALGISTVVIKTGISDDGYAGLTTSVSPSSFKMIRSEPVNQEDLINFIAPDIFDNDFTYGDGTPLEQLDEIQIQSEVSNLFIKRKYKGSSNTIVSDYIKTEGIIELNDPKNKMDDANIVTAYESGAGMFIEGVRAFSSDNNPWTDDEEGTNDKPDSLETKADLVSIGELYFGNHTGGPIITGSGFDGTHSTTELTGVKKIDSGTVAPTDFTHKIPVKIEDVDGNVETYSLLLVRNTENTSTLP
tara:strand:+ start:2281 stop:3714 length:1434 start_codon:yes stop_codon:yes gene_type:complete